MIKYLLHHYLEDTAAKYPEKTAVRYNTNSITYSELLEKSIGFSGLLVMSGVKPGDLVSIYLDKSIETIISMFGVLMSGGTYIPLDTHYSPLNRIVSIIRQSNSQYLITSRKLWDYFDKTIKDECSLKNLKIIFIDDSSPEYENRLCTNAKLAKSAKNTQKLTDSSLAYILYTSGSTGIPKGVMISHLNAMTFINWALEYFKPTDEWNFSNFAPLHFDLSVFDIYVSVACGGCVNLVPFEISSNPRAIVKWIKDNKISCMYSVPSLWVAILNHASICPDDFIGLNRILFAGEVFAPKYLRQLMEVIPHASFYNLYGPTETNVCTCYHVKDRYEVKDRYVPIGEACANTEVFALNEKDEPVEEGMEGELYVKGSIVMQGYHNQPYLTSAVFRKSPIQRHHGAWIYGTGDIVRRGSGDVYEFIGRKDSMVKCNGFRIELSEIELALLKNEQIKEAAVIALNEKESGKTEIYAIVSMKEGYSLSVIKMKNYLAEFLPKYIIPHSIVSINEIPKNHNGKIDKIELEKWIRTTIPEGSDSGGEGNGCYKKKIIKIISEVCDIDEEYLSIDSSIQDDIGISSVTIVETMARIEQEFNIAIENDLYNPYLYNTIGDLVKMVQDKISHT